MEYQLPRPLSHSSISMYQECPQKYKFKYLDKVPEKPRHFFSFGQSVHLALEFFYGVTALPAPTLEAVLAHYREKWVSAGYKDAAQEAEYFENGKAILADFYAKHIESYALPFFVEYGFDMEVEGVPVTGKVDRVDRLPDGRLAVLDYKTGKALAPGRLESDAQLTMYQLACETLLGAEVGKLIFYHLPSQKALVAGRRGPELVAGLKARIVATAEGITKREFEPRPEEMKCRWCDYKPICPVFNPKAAAPADAAPAGADEELALLIDRYGELEAQIDEHRREADGVKAQIADILRRKGYVRAFGRRYELSRAGPARWEFSDKKKVLEAIKRAGLYQRILAPSAPLVHQLLSDPDLEPEVKSSLQSLGVKVEASDLKVKPL